MLGISPDHHPLNEHIRRYFNFEFSSLRKLNFTAVVLEPYAEASPIKLIAVNTIFKNIVIWFGYETRTLHWSRFFALRAKGVRVEPRQHIVKSNKSFYKPSFLFLISQFSAKIDQLRIRMSNIP
jgi:hypothetical protein